MAACLDALAGNAPKIRPVIVVDNASTDRTVARARRDGVTVIPNANNYGFAGGANQGFREASQAGSRAVLLLNPDVVLQSDPQPLIEAAEKYGLAAGRLTDHNGKTQAGFTIRRFPTAAVLALELLGINRLWPANPWNRDYRYLDFDLSQPSKVEQPAGAFLMVRTDVWKQLQGLDEAFHPIWFEDVDFCNRAVKAGYEIQYVPTVTAHHMGGHSIEQLPQASKQVYWYDSLLRYAAKHFRPWPRRGVVLAAMLSVVPRTIINMLRERSFKPVTTSFEILNLAGRRLVSDARPTQRLRRDTKT